jgi:hypothetical protein
MLYCRHWRHFVDLYSHLHGTGRKRRERVRYGRMKVFYNAACDNSPKFEQVLSVRVIYSVASCYQEMRL